MSLFLRALRSFKHPHPSGALAFFSDLLPSLLLDVINGWLLTTNLNAPKVKDLVLVKKKVIKKLSESPSHLTYQRIKENHWIVYIQVLNPETFQIKKWRSILYFSVLALFEGLNNTFYITTLYSEMKYYKVIPTIIYY